MPFLPPTELSTWDNNVVGTNTNLIPRKIVLATKLDKSPTVPPPMAIKVEDRSIFNFKRSEIIFQ